MNGSGDLGFDKLSNGAREEFLFREPVRYLEVKPVANPQRGFVDLFVVRGVAHGTYCFSLNFLFREHARLHFPVLVLSRGYSCSGVLTRLVVDSGIVSKRDNATQ